MKRPALFPDGHFYSPVVDVEEILANKGCIWRRAAIRPMHRGLFFRA